MSGSSTNSESSQVFLLGTSGESKPSATMLRSSLPAGGCDLSRRAPSALLAGIRRGGSGVMNICQSATIGHRVALVDRRLLRQLAVEAIEECFEGHLELLVATVFAEQNT